VVTNLDFPPQVLDDQVYVQRGAASEHPTIQAISPSKFAHTGI
jgi:hypothetical protein